jgi:NAD(P)-dependent dehydrogenase (short-subunit alcohol dehydrogenase family)
MGLATCRTFLEAGAQVHGVARRRDLMIAEVGQPWVDSSAFVAHGLDISDADAVEAMMADLAARGTIDVMVLAAGTNVLKRRLGELSRKDWEEIVATNLNSAFYFIRSALSALRDSNGLVVTIASVSGRWPDAAGPAYAASKAGLLALSAAAGYEEHYEGIRFTSILPGRVDTPMLDNRRARPSAEVRALSLKPEDVAQLCVFLAALPPHITVPDVTILPTALQSLGNHWPGLPKGQLSP